MTKPIAMVAILAAAAAVSGCQTIQRAAGATKTSPDEFRVVSQAPLTLPPDYSLRPPRPGEPRPTELEPDAEARAAIFGTDTGQNASAGEGALVRAAGADAVEANVRDQVDFEGANIVHRSDAFTNRVLSFTTAQQDAAQTLDPAAEEARLREQESIRRATGGGTVVIQRNASGGFKLPGT